MSNVTYNRENLTITLAGLDTVEKALGDLRQKTPAAAKVAINATAREARKLMIARAKARYAVNTAGIKHLKNLKQTGKATNKNPTAILRVISLPLDMGYFETDPPAPKHFTGKNWRKGPEVWRGRVLRADSKEPLIKSEFGDAKVFLAEFISGHIGSVFRVKGSSSKHTTTEKGYPRWRDQAGNVEKTMTYNAPSETAMHNTIWPDVVPEVEEILMDRMELQTRKILDRAADRIRKE